MEYGYIIKLSNKNLYKEIQIPYNYERMSVGMDMDCDVRLYKDVFFDKFRLDFSKEGGHWQIVCSDNVYIDEGNVIKKMMADLNHGSVFKIRNRDSDSEVVQIEFMFDFDNENKNYDCQMDLGSVSSLVIGDAENYDIAIHSQYTAGDKLVIEHRGSVLRIKEQRARYGVYHNGKRVKTGETIKSGDFMSIADISFYFKDGKLYTENSDKVHVRNLPTRVDERDNGYPKFVRNARIKREINKEQIQILDPPAKPQQPKNNLLTRLLPSLGMIVAAVVMGAMGGTTMIIMSGVSAVMSIVTAVLGIRESKKDFKKSSEDRIKKYKKYTEDKRNEILKYREEEKELLDQIYISQNKEKEQLFYFSSDLFDRRPRDPDFLAVRLGTGEVESSREIAFKKQENLEIEDDLQLIPEKMYTEFKYIHEAPVVCDFKTINALAVVGQEQHRYNIFKNIVFDICIRQYPSDVKLILVASEENKDRIKWLRMLPHVNNEHLGIKNIICNDESKNILFDYLYKEITARSQSKGKVNDLERIVVLFYDEYGFKNHPLSKFADSAKDLGVTFVFFEEKRADVPQCCDYIALTIDGTTGELYETNGKSERTFSYPILSDFDAIKMVEMLAPIYTEEISLEGALTKNISLFELLDIIAVDDIDLGKRWAESEVYKSMAAPLGVTKSSLISLDLHDKAHGPHGLVAGTTGSGKSEILQTYILSMATLFSPTEVGFVIIDFKGGGMANQFKDLPHMIGAITNIDGKEINRSLKSIKAELQKRQRLFAEADVNHIDKYIKKFKNGETQVPLPHLIIIVDEFAELKAEQPEFMKELISAARIGRSLGVHLILATQKPAGQVNEQIWSNSRFKLCLKVQSQEDSNEVLKSPLAAEIKEPGRAYLQVGNNEVFELFQSAYSGAPERNSDVSIKNFSILQLTDSGKKIPVFAQKKNANSEGRTQLEAIVDYVGEYCRSNNIPKLNPICLPPLETVIKIPQNISNGEKFSIGVYDDPDTQYQGEAWLNFDSENTFIVGASQTGKTNLLQLIIREIATCRSANEANFYIMDFGSMILRNFENLNHVGGVVISSEEEKLKNLFKLIMGELEQRKQRLMMVGVSSISSYKEAGYTDIPHIYLMLDNFAVFKELYAEKYEDDLLYIAREGVTYGISIIITSSTTQGFGYKYMSNFSNHIAFSCNDRDEYSNLFDRCRMEPTNTPGRMLISINKNVYEAQSFISFEGHKEIDRVAAITEFVEKRNCANLNCYAKKIPEVPYSLNLEYIQKNFSCNPKKEIAIALSYQHVEPVILDIYTTTQIAIIGKLTTNMLNCEKAFLDEIRYSYFDRQTEAYIIDSIGRELVDYSEQPFVEKYTIDYTTLASVFEQITEELERRFEEVLEDGIGVLDKKPLIFVMINNPEAIGFISSSKELMSMYNAMTNKYKQMKILVVLAGLPDEAIGYSSGDLLKSIKEKKKAFILSNIAEHKTFDIPSAFVRQNKKAIDPTQGYYLNESEIVKIRMIKEE